MDKIILNNLKFFGHLGCSPEEKFTPQSLIIDVELNLNLQPSGQSDSLNDSVDYVEVKSLIQSIVEGTSKNLIESLAEDIAQNILSHFNLIDSINVKIFKPASDASIIIFRSKQVIS